MKMRKFYAPAAAAALLALTVACGDGANVNVNTNANANVNRTSNVNANINDNTTAGGSAYNRNYNTRDEYGREDANYRSEAKNRNESIGQGVEDGWIHFKTRTALLAADDLRDSTINVDVDNNVVTLRGTVANNAQKTKAEQVAKGIDGVKSVTNRLTVNANAGVLSGNGNGNANSGARGNSNR